MMMVRRIKFAVAFMEIIVLWMANTQRHKSQNVRIYRTTVYQK